MSPRIITYAAQGDDVPENMRGAAAMVPTGPGTHWQATGATPEEARAKLLDFWEKNEAERPRKPRKPRKAKAEDDGDVGDVI